MLQLCAGSFTHCHSRSANKKRMPETPRRSIFIDVVSCICTTHTYIFILSLGMWVRVSCVWLWNFPEWKNNQYWAHSRDRPLYIYFGTCNIYCVVEENRTIPASNIEDLKASSFFFNSGEQIERCVTFLPPYFLLFCTSLTLSIAHSGCDRHTSENLTQNPPSESVE